MREMHTMKSNSRGQENLHGKELDRSYVHKVSNKNEQLFEAVVAGTTIDKDQSMNQSA